MAVLEDDSVLAFGELPGKDVYELRAPVATERITALRPLPIFVLGGLSAMWCIERGLGALI